MKLNKSQRKFLDSITEQDRQQHINASDAELEELHETPKHRHRPNVDWDRFNNQIPKGK